MTVTLDTVLSKQFVQAAAQKTCGHDYEIVERPAAFVLRNKEEGERDVSRLIVLPPKGYTANAPDQTNSHEEVEHATIKIKGAVRAGKKSFSRLKNCLLVVSFNKNGSVSDLNKPYLTFDVNDDDPEFVAETHSAGEPPFYVVRSNGYGFYHNLINLTNDWLLLALYKRLRPQQEPDLERHFDGVQDEYANILRELYDQIVKQGDCVFENQPELIRSVLAVPPSVSLPALGEMLYSYDTGRHEACTAFAMILNVAKRSPEIVEGFLQEALENGEIPSYYAGQLLEKIDRMRPDDIRRVQERNFNVS